MSTSTGIEWTDTTWTTLAGCQKVSAGCKHCYAQTMTHRLAAMSQAARKRGDEPGKLAAYEQAEKWDGTFVPIPGALAEPLRWKKPRRVFVDSMSDIFGEGVPNKHIAAVFAVMAVSPHLTFQILTKRSERMAEWFKWAATSYDGLNTVRHLFGDADYQKLEDRWLQGNARDMWPLPNVWIGTSVEDQECADARIPTLLQIPAAVRFLSCEPLLGRVTLRPTWVESAEYPEDTGLPAPVLVPGIDWIIIGGESGPGARVMAIDWARDLLQQCASAGVPLFVKQDSGIVSGNQGRFTNDEWRHKEFPNVK